MRKHVILSATAAMTYFLFVRFALSENTHQVKQFDANCTKVTFGAKIEKFLPEAEGGDLCAMYKVGFIYTLYPQTKERISNAIKWYTAAAEKGLAEAQFKIATIHLWDHYSLPSNSKAEGMKWMRAAFDQGYLPAYESFGNFYKYGLFGFPKDYNKAVEIYRFAAEQGHRGSQRALAYLYSFGVGGVRKDIAEGLRWALISGEDQASAMSRVSTAYLYEYNFEEARNWADKVGAEGDEAGRNKLLKEIQTWEENREKREAARRAEAARQEKHARKAEISVEQKLLLLLGGAIIADIGRGLAGERPPQDDVRAKLWQQERENSMRQLRQEIARDQEAAWGLIGN